MILPTPLLPRLAVARRTISYKKSMAHDRLKEVLQKIDLQLPDAQRFTPPIFICTLGSERSFRTEYASAITARIDDGNHLIIVEDDGDG